MAEPTVSTPVRYHGAAIALHWLLALLLAYQFALGLRLEDKVAPSAVFTAFQQHKSVGIAILLLSLLRLALRYTKPRPAEIGTGLELLAARAAHTAFYAIMLLGPLSGWIIVSTAKIKVPTLLFGLVPWPHLPVPAGMHDPAALGHSVLGWALPALFVLHVAAVLYHWRQRDPVPGRMLPAAVKLGTGLAAGLGAVLLAGLLGRAGPIPDLWSSLTAPAPAAAPLPETSDPVDVAILASEAPEPAISDEPVATEAAASCDWAVAPGSRLGFVADYSGTPVNGSFRKWDAKIRFCEADPAAGSIAATVALASADTADASRDENLKGPAFFDIAANPQARFAAKGFKQLAPGRFAADGTLTLHGKSRPVRLVFTLKITGDKAVAQGSARLSRLAFGVGSDEWAATDELADAVSVTFAIQAKRR